MNRYRTLPGLGPQKATANTLPSKGVADQQLAEAEARRTKLVAEPEDRGRSPIPDSSDSVSTISTNKSRSRSRSRSRDRDDDFFTSGRASRNRSRTPPTDIPRKRKHRSISSSYSRSPRSPRREPRSHRKSRRHRTISPIDRGRPSSMRRGSHRSRTSSPSMDKSQITKQRRSLETEDHVGDGPWGRRQGHDDNDRHALPQRDFRVGGEKQSLARERSLSPYSKRLALTQAMNM
ncbi:uncharacterized protein Z519_02584 [Cladophialophora bantiana CBS 173.52]|uniref:Uncharacterized protein n=1 Tax=Cladophialophora bantiana (strain ATCC 10958 / CBS 173.52 / CDC B-1940 / NIH 8579) TaxID=1442370 RepID=A0A0D2GFN7_CLAB1|nr:uncharacterized protein Z519_02584 [Cladophialophora bantiana CBS 173.52]KIW97192.1 hypothetical protein Z519_02584 [Cladophialophora bantiana CBS 173.52]